MFDYRSVFVHFWVRLIQLLFRLKKWWCWGRCWTMDLFLFGSRQLSENMKIHEATFTGRFGHQHWNLENIMKYCVCVFIFTYSIYTTYINISQWFLNVWQFKTKIPKSKKISMVAGFLQKLNLFHPHLPKGLHHYIIAVWCGAVNQ